MTTALGAFIRERRKQLGYITQTSFAEHAEMAPAHLSQIESGKIALPSADLRRKIAAGLGVSHVDLLIAAGELAQDEVQDAGVQGVVGERPVDYVHRVVDAYEWDLKTAAVVIDMIDVWMKAWTGETPTTTRIPITFMPRPEEDEEDDES